MPRTYHRDDCTWFDARPSAKYRWTAVALRLYMMLRLSERARARDRRLLVALVRYIRRGAR